MTADIVGRSRPRQRHRDLADRDRRQAGRRGRRRRVGRRGRRTGSRREVRSRGARDVAGGVHGGNPERVGGAAGEAREAVARSRRRSDLGAVAEHAVAGDADIVGRRSPRQGRRGLPDRARREAGWSGGRRRVRRRGRPGRLRSGRWPWQCRRRCRRHPMQLRPACTWCRTRAPCR